MADHEPNASLRHCEAIRGDGEIEKNSWIAWKLVDINTKHKTLTTQIHTQNEYSKEKQAKTSCANHSPTQSTYLSLPCTLKLSRTWRWSQSLSRCLQPVQSLSSLHFQHLWCEDQMGRCDNIQQCNIQLFSLLLTPTLWNLQSANFLRFWKYFIFRIWSDLIHQMK